MIKIILAEGTRDLLTHFYAAQPAPWFFLLDVLLDLHRKGNFSHEAKLFYLNQLKTQNQKPPLRWCVLLLNDAIVINYHCIRLVVTWYENGIFDTGRSTAQAQLCGCSRSATEKLPNRFRACVCCASLCNGCRQVAAPRARSRQRLAGETTSDGTSVQPIFSSLAIHQHKKSIQLISSSEATMVQILLALASSA